MNVVHSALAQGLAALGDMLVGENIHREMFEQITHERGCLLEKLKVEKIEKKKPERTLLQKNVVMKAYTCNLVDLKKICDFSRDGEELVQGNEQIGGL